MSLEQLDALLDVLTTESELEFGVLPSIVSSRSALSARAVATLGHATKRKPHSKNPKWSEAENAFLLANLGKLSEEMMALHLGRTVCAIHLHWKRDLRLKSPSNQPNELTCEQIAQGLNIDGHQCAALIDRGILPGRRLPLSAVVRVVERQTLLRWLVNPLNWIYFNPRKIGVMSHYRTRRGAQKFDAGFWAYARRLVTLKRARWHDEWWRIGRVARHHKVDSRVINRAIHLGYLPATDWGNWWILKSHATNPKIRFFTGKGRPGCTRTDWTKAADNFLLRARKQGLKVPAIARMMKKSINQVTFRLATLRKAKIKYV